MGAYTNEELERIIYRFKDMVYRVAMTHTRNVSEVDDIFQEVFLRLVRQKKPFDDDAHLKAWLLRVTINCACDLHRAPWTKRTVSYEDELEKNRKGGNAFFEPVMWLADDGPDDFMREVTLEAVRALPQRLRSVIFLFYYEGMNIAEIADMLNIQPNAVKTRLSRARGKLKKALGASLYV